MCYVYQIMLTKLLWEKPKTWKAIKLFRNIIWVFHLNFKGAIYKIISQLDALHVPQKKPAQTRPEGPLVQQVLKMHWAMLSLALSSVPSLNVFYWHSVKNGRGPTVIKGGRKRRFSCTNMNMWPARPKNKEQDITQGVWCHFVIYFCTYAKFVFPEV